MAQPMLARLRVKHPRAPIDMLAPPWVAPVARRMPEVSEVLEADLRHGELQLGDRWRLGRLLKARGYKQAYVLPNTMKSALAPSFARIPERIGYLGESRVVNDFPCDCFDRCFVAPREKKTSPLACKGACDRAADRASGSINHCNLVLQYHLCFP